MRLSHTIPSDKVHTASSLSVVRLLKQLRYFVEGNIKEATGIRANSLRVYTAILSYGVDRYYSSRPNSIMLLRRESSSTP